MTVDLVLVYLCWSGVAVCALGALAAFAALFFDLEGVTKGETSVCGDCPVYGDSGAAGARLVHGRG